MPKTVTTDYDALKTKKEISSKKGKLTFHLHREGASFAIDQLTHVCHAQAVSMEWWHTATINGYQPKILNVGERYALMHSELSEGMEAARKDILKSEHIPEFTGEEEELADAIIRIFDYARAAKLRLGDAFVAKLKFNMERPDHKPEARNAKGGKKF